MRSETTPDTILRLTEVLKRTGLSRATIYNRIAKREFPHQVSLGARAVGWLEEEIEDWIDGRVLLRPESATTGISERGSDERFAAPKSVRCERLQTQRSIEQARCKISVNVGAPDPADLHLRAKERTL